MFANKKVSRIFGVICMILLAFSTVLGCSSQTNSEQKSSGGESASGSKEVKQLKIATATTTGAFYPVGGMMASILSKNMEGYNFTAEATGGSIENARLIDAGKAQIGFFGADSTYNAYHGKEAFEGKPIKLAALAQIYVNPFHIVTLKKSGIKTVKDLEGKKVAVGAPGSGTSGKAKILLEEYGLQFDKNIKAEFLDFKEGADALTDGTVDAVIISVGLPSGNVQELATSHEISLVSFAEDKADEIAKKLPYFSKTIIPKGTYKGIDEDVLTMGAPNEIAVDPNLDEELVYQMTKMLYETHFDEFISSHASMKDSKLEIAPNTGIPLHPGAARFYKEKGVLK